MKKICFIEAEGILLPLNNYSPKESEVRPFFKELIKYCETNKILLYVLSGFHEKVAHKKFDESILKEHFDKKSFLHPTEKYVSSKSEDDQKLHREKLSKDPEFNDSYFKQVIIQEVLKEKNIAPSDALLLSDDIWVDGYYTTRFSKADFAIFEGNVTDRGKPVERIQGLAYFSFDFNSVKQLLENFPAIDLRFLDKYVFDVMKAALVGDSVKDSLKKSIEKKMHDKYNGGK